MTALDSVTIIGSIVAMGGLFLILKFAVTGIVDGMKGSIDALRGEMNARFDSIERRLGGIDDVQKLTEKVFGR